MNDALKAWGDVLAKQGHPRAALEKHDDALMHAPHWSARQEARTALAQRQT
jgi:uncharacterized protein GlcG (DUF336 family)